MRVDQGFVDSVMATTEGRYPHEIIEATLAVAAERGLVVGEGAVRMWAVKSAGGRLTTSPLFKDKFQADINCYYPSTVVRVAVVEIKE